MLKKSVQLMFLIILLIVISGCALDTGLKSKSLNLESKCDAEAFVNFLMDNPDATMEEIYQAANRYKCEKLIKGTTYQQRFQPLILENNCPALGDLNGDGGWNVLDIVTLANCVLAGNCGDLSNGCAGDLNGDGGYNVLDIVTLANCVLVQNCSG